MGSKVAALFTGYCMVTTQRTLHLSKPVLQDQSTAKVAIQQCSYFFGYTCDSQCKKMPLFFQTLMWGINGGKVSP